MSVFTAMNAAVSGMRAMGQQMSAISDNLANAQTVGYKKVDMRFQEMVTTSNPNRHNAGGVMSAPLLQVNVQGAITRTTSTTNLAIDGNGLFSLSKPNYRTDGTLSFESNYFGRGGDFEMDKNGYLVNSAGYMLNGWAVTDPDKRTVNPNEQPIRITRMRDAPSQTTYVNYTANLPKVPDKAQDTDSATPDIEFPPTQVRVYDKFGEARDLSMTWVKLDPSDAANAGLWRLDLSVNDGDLTNGAGPGTGISYTVQFSPDDGTLQWINPGATPPVPAPTPAAGTVQNIDLGILDPGATGPWNIELRLGKVGDAADSITQFASEGIQMPRPEQDGVPPGSFQGITIDKDGFVNMNYTNGRVVPAFKIPLAVVPNPNAMSLETGAVFRATAESGLPTLVSAGEFGAGRIAPTSVETSNVDIADEFTKMIVGQRVYSANARMVSASDEILQETINLAR